MGGLPPWAWRILVVFLRLVALVVAYQLVMNVLRVVAWRTHWKPGIDLFRWYNKKTVNRSSLKRPGKRVTVVHHTGRRSGRDYATPVWAERTGESFFIQLPYGTDVDWCRNVLAAGHCTLERDGVLYDTVAPEITPADEAVPFLPGGMRRMQQLARVESYLRLDISSAENPAKKAG